MAREIINLPVIDWFRCLPMNIRKRALENTEVRKHYETAHSLADAIAFAFDWGDSWEGTDYWMDIHYKTSKFGMLHPEDRFEMFWVG